MVRTPVRPIFFPRIYGGHCDRIHSSLTAVRCFDNGYVGKQPVAWKENCPECWLKELQPRKHGDRTIYPPDLNFFRPHGLGVYVGNACGFVQGSGEEGDKKKSYSKWWNTKKKCLFNVILIHFILLLLTLTVMIMAILNDWLRNCWSQTHSLLITYGSCNA